MKYNEDIKYYFEAAINTLWNIYSESVHQVVNIHLSDLDYFNIYKKLAKTHAGYSPHSMAFSTVRFSEAGYDVLLHVFDNDPPHRTYSIEPKYRLIETGSSSSVQYTMDELIPDLVESWDKLKAYKLVSGMGTTFNEVVEEKEEVIPQHIKDKREWRKMFNF